jgi:hypothetical protein
VRTEQFAEAGGQALERERHVGAAPATGGERLERGRERIRGRLDREVAERDLGLLGETLVDEGRARVPDGLAEHGVALDLDLGLVDRGRDFEHGGSSVSNLVYARTPPNIAAVA